MPLYKATAKVLGQNELGIIEITVAIRADNLTSAEENAEAAISKLGVTFNMDVVYELGRAMPKGKA